MRRNLFFLISFFLFQMVTAQEKETLRLTPTQVEALFLQQNLQLIAERMNIGIAEAQVVQAKLWENPNFSISGVNFWNPSGHGEDGQPAVPPLFGSFAKNTQFSIELSQLILTANKREKLVAREKMAKDIAIEQFEMVLRGLKVELRKTIQQIVYLEEYFHVIENEQTKLDQLIDAYKKQVAQGNFSKSDLVRLQSSALELDNEANETQTALNEQTKTLKALLAADPLTKIVILEETSSIPDPDSIIIAGLFQKAEEYRSDLKINKLETQYFNKSLAYEKAQRIPNLTVSANYDRSGGVWKDFVGFGVSFDLPFLNRNQGAIKAACIAHEQSKYKEKQLANQVQQEVMEAYANYQRAYTFYQKVNSNELLAEADKMLGDYTKNLLNRNVSMIEFVDFMNTYKSNKQTALNAKRSMQMQFEELQYRVGTEIK
jgi:cobalt-zinc-cadmium efflux system outer membrane protein